MLYVGAQTLEFGQAEVPSGNAPQQFSELLERYPNLSEIELARLINLYREELSALDAALMISDENFGPKLDRFFDDNRSKIRTPFRQYAILIAIPVVGIAVIAWALAF